MHETTELVRAIAWPVTTLVILIGPGVDAYRAQPCTRWRSVCSRAPIWPSRACPISTSSGASRLARWRARGHGEPYRLQVHRAPDGLLTYAAVETARRLKAG